MGNESSRLISDQKKQEELKDDQKSNQIHSGFLRASDSTDRVSKISDGQIIENMNHEKHDDNTVNTIFKWGYGGLDVKITGSFNKWANPIPMTKNGNDFILITKLERGLHQYKFIVDGEWKYSPDDKYSTDLNGNINNIVDITQITLPSDIIDNKTDNKLQAKDFRNQNDLVNSGNRKISMNSPTRSPSRKRVSLELDIDKNFSEKAPQCPVHLQQVKFLQQKERKQYSLWQEKQQTFDIQKQNEVYCKNTPQEDAEVLWQFFDCDRGLNVPDHSMLKHIGFNKNYNSSNYQEFASSYRFKGKQTTYKLYTMKNQ